MSLLSIFTGSWKKKDDAAPPAPVPAAPRFAPTALEERQRLLGHHVRLVARGMANGLCVYGSRGGLGKTRVVLETLKEEGISPLVLNGHITPLSLFSNLLERPDAVLFLDDCDSLFRNLPALGILRSALWGETDDKRLVTYNSSQLKIPSSFYFTGRVIFAINTLAESEPRIRRRAQPGRPVRAVGFQRGSAGDDAAAGGAGVRGAGSRRVPGGRGLHCRVLGDEGTAACGSWSRASARSFMRGKRGWTGGNSSPASSTRSGALPSPRSPTPGLTTWNA